MESYCLPSLVLKCHLPLAQVLHIDYGLDETHQILPKGMLLGNYKNIHGIYTVVVVVGISDALEFD